MLNNWKTYKLSDALEIKYGKDHKKVQDGTIPIYGTGGIMRYGNQALYDKETILIPRKGSLNNIFYLNEPFWSVDTIFWSKINEEVAFPKYLFYNLKVLDFASMDVGSAIPSLTTELLKKIEIELPSLEEQQSIASILSAIDDKIENNLAINKTLEEMAMALYKHWFVDFGPFKDGEFVECEIFGINNLISIPKDFKILYIKEEITRLKSTSKYIQDNVLKVGKTRVFDQSSNRILGYHNNQPDFKADFENPLLIFGDHTCRMELICENFSVGPNLIPFKTDTKEYTYLVYLTLKDKVRMNDYKRHWSELMLHQFIVPNDMDIINDFNNSVKEFFNLINKNEIENQSLTQLRDTLLPKLISGEVRLKEFREKVV